MTSLVTLFTVLWLRTNPQNTTFSINHNGKSIELQVSLYVSPVIQGYCFHPFVYTGKSPVVIP